MSFLIRTDQKIAAAPAESGEPIRLSGVISALSFALDLTEGQPMGHSVRACVLAMRIGQQLGLSKEILGDLYYAALMKDAGCSTNASKMASIFGSDEIKAKRDVKVTDWTRVGWESLHYVFSHMRPGRPFLERMQGVLQVAMNQKTTAKEMVYIRCERGASIARQVGLSETAAEAIGSLDELWNGAGQPKGSRGREIPLLARILGLAQTVEVFFTAYGAKEAIAVARRRSGRWFDPELVRALKSAATPSLWYDMDNAQVVVAALAPEETLLEANDATLDRVCLAFADVIDAKSPFTYNHSAGVAGAAVSIAKAMSMTESEVRTIRRAGLLHDIGKLSVPNTILDKPGKLTDEEFQVVKKHPHYTLEILRRVPGFGSFADLAASHHEKLNGRGYFRNMTAEQMSLPARILVVADIFDALAAKRPYRDALPLETVFDIMGKDAPTAIDGSAFEALQSSSSSVMTATQDLLSLSQKVGTSNTPNQKKEENRISCVVNPA